MLRNFSKMLLCLFTSCSFLGGASPAQEGAKKPPMVILLGAPGSGKGTQAAAIVKEFGIVHISTGDMFRANIRENTPIGLTAKKYMDAGQLVPDEVVIEMLRLRLKQSDCAMGALLDGFPRTLGQAKALEALLDGTYVPVVLSLEVADATVLERLTGRRACPNCNAIYHATFSAPKKAGICDACETGLVIRSDDTEQTVKERLKIFHEQIGPLKEFYASKRLLSEVNGELGADKTAQACSTAIHARLSA